MDKDNKEFKKLQKNWYNKLKDEGFKDIEKNGLLQKWHNNTTLKLIDRIDSKIKQEYYTLATHFYNAYKFKNLTEKVIWGHHSEGMSIRQITATMKSAGHKIYKFKVQKTVSDLRLKMKEYASITYDKDSLSYE